MACTYSEDLNTDRDWVRFLTADTDVPDGCRLSDEEIDAVIAEEVARNGQGPWTKYCASAEALAAGTQDGTITEASTGTEVKRVGRLQLEKGAGAVAMAELREREKRLRARCAREMDRRPSAFSTLGKRRRRCGRGC